MQWQEFTPETIRLAKELDKPIFLSSGYSACHWCATLPLSHRHRTYRATPLSQT